MAQPSSGTTNFQPSMIWFITEAYSRLKIRGPSITAQHLYDAVNSANLLQVEWNGQDGPNLWKVTLNNIPLVQGQATYSVPSNVIDILDYYLRLPTLSNGQTQDIVVTPISRTEYADQPNKNLQARPTTVWWDRLTNSSVTLWPTPDANGPYTLYYYCETQVQDVVGPQAVTPDIPYRFIDAFAAGLAARLAVKYSEPPVAELMIQLADKAWALASGRDVERVPLYIIPGIGFYRN